MRTVVTSAQHRAEPARHLDATKVAWPVGLGAIALIIDLIAIERPALWRDEMASIVVARRSPAAIVQMLHHDDAPLGAYYLFLHFWIQVSASALWLRLPSALAAAGSVVFLFLLGKRLGGLCLGAVAASVLAVLPFTTLFAQQVRPYALVMCGATAASWFLVLAIQDRRRPHWIAYSVIITLTVALHVIAITLVAAHLLTCILVNRNRYREYRSWLISVIPAALVGAALAALTAGDSTSHAWIPKTNVHTPYDAARDFAGSRPALALLLAVTLAGALIAVLSRTSDSGHMSPSRGVQVNTWSLGLPWLLLPAGLLMMISFAYPLFVSRYVLFSLPAMALVVAGGAVSMSRAVRRSRAPRAPVAGLALVTAIALVAAVAKPQVDLRRVGAHTDDPKAEASYLLSVARPGDGIVYSPRDLEHSLVSYGSSRPLPVDALLAVSPTASATLNGVEVAPSKAAASMLKFSRLWVLDVPGFEDTTAVAAAARAALAAHFRQVTATDLDGAVLVLYERVGTGTP